MFSTEQLQRFSIRKLTVGAASVLIGVLFLTSWNTNKVYADSRNVANGESIAKNNNPQEGNPAVNKDNVQIVDNDSTEVSNISDSKSSKVIKNDATKSDIVRDKTTIDDNSRTKAPELTAQANNKHALTTVTEDNDAKVSKTEKNSNSDIKTQSKNSEKMQETTLVKKVLGKEKSSSESLIDQKNLDGKIEISATDPSNYPSDLNGLIGYDKYIYQVLSLDSGSKLILSVNRKDPNDENIYAYVYVTDGNYESVGDPITIGMDQNYITIDGQKYQNYITIDGREYLLNNNGSSEVTINTINGETVQVHTQNSSTVTSEPRHFDPFPIGQDYGLGNTSNDNCSAIGEIVPVFTENSVIKYYYRDNKGHLQEFKNSELPNMSVKGFTGQEFEIKDVGQYKKVIKGYYLTSDNLPTGDFKGTLSQFSGDKYYKKVYYDFDTDKVEYSVLYHQISPDGTMEICVLDDNDRPLTESKKIKPNTSIEFSNYDHTLTVGVRNPYVTAAPHEVQFIYKKLGSIIPVDKNGKQIGDAIQFENDPKDPTEALPGKVPSISGYHPKDRTVGDKVDPDSEDPSKDITVTYVKSGTISVKYHDNTEDSFIEGYGKDVQGNEDDKFSYDPTNDLKTLTDQGYVLDGEMPEIPAKFTDGAQEVIIYLKHGVQEVKPGTDIPKKPDGTTAVDPNSLTKEVDLTVQYVNRDGTKFTGDVPKNPNQTVTFTGTAYVDKVTGELVNAKQQADGTWEVDDSKTDKPQVIWTVKDGKEDKGSFTGVTSPSEEGYEITGVEVKVGGQDAEDASAYTDGKDVKAVDGIDHNHGNIHIIVSYAKSSQNAKLTVIDENTGKHLGDYSEQGGYKDKIDFGQAPQDINNYISKGYVWDTARTGAANYEGLKIGDYDSDPKQDQSWNVYLKHGVQEVKPGTDIPKKPDGTTAVDPNSLTKEVDLTVQYVNRDGTKFTGDVPKNPNQTVTFTGTAYVDKVTGELVNAKQQADGTWEVDDSKTDKPQVIWTVKDGKEDKGSFTGVTSPSEEGYEITGVEVKVGGQDAEDASAYTDGKDVKAVDGIDHNHGNIHIIVSYAKSSQNAKLTVIDENTGKHLGDYSEQGGYKDKIDFGQAPQDINNYISKGYVWDTARTGAANYEGLKIGDYDSDPKQDQSWNVYLKHGVQEVKPGTDIPKKPDGTTAVDPNSLTKEVDLTVQYVNRDGTKFTGDVPKNPNQTVTFTGTAYVDKVTGELVNAKQQADGTWEVDDSKTDKPQVIWTVKDGKEDKGSFTGVTSPSEEGYEITGVEVKVGGQDAEDASAYTDGKDVKAVDGIDHNHGNIHIIVSYAKSSQNAKLTVIDENTGKHLGDYSEQGGYKDKIDFGQAPQDINNYISKGYVWDTARTGAANYEGLKIGDYDSDPKQDQSWNVYLKHGVQEVKPGTDIPKKPDGTTAVDPNSLTKEVDLTVQYVNRDGTKFTGDVPKNPNQTVTFTGTAYVDKVTGELVNAKQQADGTWEVDDSKTDKPQVIWTVKDGKEDKGSFTGVTSPSEEGYEITGVEVKVGGQDAEDASAYTDGKDVKAVDGIDHNHGNIHIIVSYAKSSQNAKLTVIDENTGKHLGDYSEQGGYKDKIDFGQAPQDINNYISKGYVWDTARTGAANYEGLKIGDYDSDPKQDQSWNVYLKHGVQEVKPGTDIPKKPDGTTAVDPNSLTKEVDLTVQYVNRDGTKFTGDVPKNPNQTVTFTGTAYVDKVTGELVNAKQQADGTWEVDDSKTDKPQVIWTVKDGKEDKGSFTGVTSPSEEGYEITGVEVKVGGQDAEDASAYTDGKDVKAVDGIDHNHGNIHIIVSYAKSSQNAKLTVIDENTGKHLGDYSEQGGYKDKIDFGQAPQDINNYISKGYVWDTARTGAANYEGLKIGDYDSDPKQDQSWNVYLKHGVQEVKPGTDIPKKPDGTTAVDPNSLTKEVDLTVQYVNRDGTKFTGDVPKNPNQTVTFTGTAYVDKVTGELVNAKQQADGTWEVDDSKTDKPQVIWTVKDGKEDKGSFTGVTSPSEEGYEITGVEVKVGGQDAEDASAYTDGKDVKAVDGIDHNHGNIHIIVSYAKSSQNAKLTVIDENTGKHLGDYSEQGGYKDKIDFGQAPQDINNYISKGYVWDTARTGAANYEGLKIGDYDSDPKQDQSWNVYLKHGVQEVKPGTDIPKKPDGTTAVDPNSLTKEVDLTVQYVNRDGTKFTGDVPKNPNQTVTFTGTAYVDKVTGELVNAKQQADGTWEVDDSKTDKPQVIWTVKDGKEDKGSFTGVTSPSEEGYEITGVEVKVGGQDAEDASAYTDGKDVKAVDGIDHNHGNIHIIVSYAKSSQNAKLTVIDENTGKHLGDYSEQGGYKDKIDFGQAPQDINNYISKGYVWDTARTGAANYEGLKIGDYDSDPKQDQSWNVYLKHGVQEVKPGTDIPKKPDGTTAVDPNSLTKEVDLTVQYVNRDGTKFTGDVPKNPNQTVTFTGTAYVDKVTGELVNAKQQADGTWEVDDSKTDKPQVIWTVKDGKEDKGSFTGVTSPSEEGYEITGVEVKVGGQDAEDASAYTDGKDVKAVDGIDHNHGNIHIIVSYAKSSQNAKLTVIDENTGKHLGDYSEQGGYKDKIDFGQAPQDINNYISKGYVWDTARTGAANYEGLKIGDYDSDPKQDQSWNVYLKHGVQEVKPGTDIPKKPDGTTAVDPNSLTKEVDLTVQYVNRDGTKFTGDVPKNPNQTVTFTGTAYVDKVTGELVNAKQQADGTWEVDDSKTDKPQVIWTVKDGKEDKGSFTGVTSPSEEGYEITGVEVKVGGQDAEDASAYTDGKDVKAVDGIDHNHGNIHIIVSYAKSSQNAKLTVIDENTGKHLGDYSEQGGYKDKIDFGQAPQDINNYISKGYVWDTARTGAANYEGLKIGDYDSDPKQDQSWNVYLKHGVQEVKPGTDIPKKPDGTTAVDPNSLTKEVDLTVQYVNRDGTKFTGDVPKNPNQTVTFTGTAYVDKVTGELVNAKQQADGTWEVDDSKTDKPQVIWTVKDGKEDKGSFTGVTSPSEEGYEITGVEVKVGGQDAEDASAYTDGKDVKAVDGIDHNHGNIHIIVSYAKSSQNAKLTVIDENTGKHLGDYSEQGGYKDKIDFGQAPQDINNYISKGYVWDTARTGAANYEGLKIGDYDSDPKQDQSWNVYLKHGVQEVKPGTDIPKKPDGTTAVDPNSLTKEVDLTVQYVNRDGTKFTGDVPKNPNQTVTFTGTAYVDKVTGELVNAKQQADGTWEVDDSKTDKPQVIWTVKDGKEDKGSFTGVTSPSEEGYEITGVEVKVGGQDAEDASAYTDGKDVKAVDGIDHNHGNIHIIVSYAKSSQNAKLTVIDENTGKHLGDYSEQGGYKDKIDFGQAPQDINNYISKGYVWDTARTGAANYEGLKIGDYDSDPKQDQSWNVYLKHGVQEVKPGTDIPKKPDGTTAVDPNSLTKEVDLTVQYVNRDGTKFTGDVPKNPNQTVTFTGTAYVDKVTGELVNAKQQADGTWEVDDSKTDKPQVIWTVKDGKEDKGSFTGVTSPSEEGYEITGVEVKVGGQDAEDASAYTDGKDVKAVDGIDHNHGNIHIIVSYAKSSQNAKLTVIDENTGKHLGDYSEQGGYKDKIDFGQAPQDINNYISKGYVWDTARTGAANYEGLKIGDYDSDPKQDQSWNVYLKHGVQEVKPGTDIPKKPDGTTAVDPNSLTKEVDLTVQYVNRDGTKFTGDVPKNPNQTVTFTGTAYVDKVTGELVNAKQQADGTWEVDDSKTDKPQVIWTVKDGKEDKGSFTGVTSPSEEGYEITGVEVKVGGQDAEDASAYTDGKDVKAVDGIDHNHGNIHIIVSYAKSSQNAKLTVIDENTGKHLGDYSEQGGYKDKIDFGQAPQDINNYISKGYVWDTARTGAANYEGLKIGDYDSDPKQDQSWNVYLKHGVQEVKPGTDIPKKPDGTTAVDPNSLTKEVDLTVQYVNRDGTKFTGDVPKNPNQTVTFTGTAYVDKVTGELVNAKQQADGTWEVDDSKTDKPQVIWTVKDGKEDKGSFTGVTSPSEEGYEITGVEVKVGGQDAEDASAYTDGKDVKAVDGIDHNHGNIHIIVSYAKSSQNAKLTVIDENTGKHLGDYSEQGGYKDKIDFGQAPQDINNYISKGYVWDTARTGAANYEGLKIGDYDSDPKQDQSWNVYLKHGVQEVKPGTDIPKKPDGTTAVDPNSLTKEVDLTVQYVNRDGTKFTGDVPKNPNQTVTFTGTAYVDKVTGELVNAKQQADGTWEVDDSKTDKPQVIWKADDKDSFDAVISPVENGYHLTGIDSHGNGNNVAEITGLTQDSGSIRATVTYTKNGKIIPVDKDGNPIEGADQPVFPTDSEDPSRVDSGKIPDLSDKGYHPVTGSDQVDPDSEDPSKDIEVKYVKSGTISVKYHDNTENSFIEGYGKDVQGNEDDKFSYDPTNDLKTLTDQGYVLDGALPTIPAKFTDGAQEVIINLKHGTTTVTPENPGMPGEPVDPDNPDGPKYPNGTEFDQVKRTGTQTIHYVGAGDKTPTDNKQAFIFTREITFDNVTGKIISKTPWNVQSHTFGNVDTPVIPGYHADKVVAGGATVTPDDLNRVITVTYAPDGNPDNPGNQGDTPTPEPTPEPEPTPNPTPDDQPDSEISSDEHFENVKAKDKLNKTNPKKVDAYKKERKIIKTKIAKQGHTEIAEPIEDKVTRENNVKVVSDPVENKAAEPKLPQTGEADNSIIGLLGMLLVSFAAMFGFDSLHSHDKKHKN
ncbi:mucin-binding protein [Lactobacillus johnsonii]|uniref:mucin-binding protein n=1 Tax=Lactobacillus johnsonii TaxID=33959 RepID=UPI0013C2A467|nr:YSIRK-type signal peptide-containing protein [Lactobacillus johnsonii]